MGNHPCNCLINGTKDIATLQVDPNMAPLPQEIIENNTSFFMSEQNKEENKVVKSGMENYQTNEKPIIEDTCPGVYLKPHQVVNRTSEKIKQTEKKLGPFELDVNIEQNNIGEIAIKVRQVVSVLYPDNTMYEGSYDEEWRKTGFGNLIFPDGSKYVGQFVDDKMNGKGRLIYSNGDFYEGDFEADKPHGMGRLVKFGEGVTFKGEFKEGVKSGMGEEVREDCSSYKGNFVDDLKSGKGRFLWSDGTVYEGDFNNNEIEGLGRIIYPEDKTYYGSWKSNKIEGKGLFYWPDGKFYVGYYQNEKKHGFGVFLYGNGKRYEGFWIQGKQHGLGMCFLKGAGRLGEWRFGKKIRWLSKDIKTNEDLAVKANVGEIKRKSDELVSFCREHGITEFDDENVKQKLLSINLA